MDSEDCDVSTESRHPWYGDNLLSDADYIPWRRSSIARYAFKGKEVRNVPS